MKIPPTNNHLNLEAHDKLNLHPSPTFDNFSFPTKLNKKISWLTLPQPEVPAVVPEDSELVEETVGVVADVAVPAAELRARRRNGSQLPSLDV